MAATCDCGWTGGPMQVRDGGKCPECFMPVRYDRAPVPERRGIASVHEFNQRARTALLQLPELPPFLDSIAVLIGNGRRLTEHQQQAFINAVSARHQQIHDREVNEYALMHARGYI